MFNNSYKKPLINSQNLVLTQFNMCLGWGNSCCFWFFWTQCTNL